MSTIEGTLTAPLPTLKNEANAAPRLAADLPPQADRSPTLRCGSPLNAKAKKILDGARSAFHELGFEGTSVDEIARRAGVSKPTLYSYFGDKQALFSASFANECQGYADSAFERADFSDSSCIESAMQRIVRDVVTYLVSPDAQAMFRSAVAETSRFPELGRSYFESGPALTKSRIVKLLGQAVEGGVFAIDDLDLAAEQLMALCKTDLFAKRLFSVGGKPSEAEINRVADGAVRLFFDGYRKRG